MGEEAPPAPKHEKWYRRIRAQLQADPEWHDGTIAEGRPW